MIPDLGIPVPPFKDGQDSSGLSTMDVRALREIFAIGDSDHSGYLSGPEVNTFLRMIGLQGHQSDAAAAARELDTVGISHLRFFQTLQRARSHRHFVERCALPGRITGAVAGW